MYKLLVKNKNLILMILILIFAAVLRLIFFSGIDSSDSLFYTSFADSVAKGAPDLTPNLNSLRIGLLYPVSVLYRLFGVNDISSNILVLLASLGSIVLAYKFGTLLFNDKVGLLSAFLLSFFPLDVVYSTVLLPDVPSAFFAALSVYFFLKSEKINKKHNSYLCCFLSGLSLGIAYLIKELSLLIVLFFMIYVVYNKKIKKEYFFIALGFALIFFIESLYFLMLTGDQFFRFSMGKSQWNTLIVFNNLYGRGSFPSGLFHYPYIIFTDNLLALFYTFIFIAAAYCIINKKKEAYSYLFWFVPLLLYLSFGSASLTKYIPFPPASRFLLIITIPGILVLSFFLLQNESLIKRILMPAIVSLLFVTSIGYLYISEYRFALDEEKLAYEFLKSLPQKQIYADERTIMVFNYLAGYKSPNEFKRFQHFEWSKPENTYAMDLSQIKNSYVVVNWRLINWLSSSKKGIRFPDEIYDIPKNWILKEEIGKNREGKIMIYYVP